MNIAFNNDTILKVNVQNDYHISWPTNWWVLNYSKISIIKIQTWVAF